MNKKPLIAKICASLWTTVCQCQSYLTLTQHVPELVYVPYHIIFQHVIEEHTVCIRSSAVLAPGSTKT
jgi:hypothetical protein